MTSAHLPRINRRPACTELRSCYHVQDKLAADENHRKMRKIYLDLVDECLSRPSSPEDANSIAGVCPHALPSLALIDMCPLSL